MSDKTVTVDQVGNAIAAIIKEYGRDLMRSEREDVRAAGKVVLDKLKATSPNKSGMYAGNWAMKMEHEGWYGYEEATVYEKAPSYRLTHLLEKGHGGPAPAPAYPHIADAAQAGMAELERRIHG